MPATDDAGAAGGDPAQPSRLALMMELAQVQTVGGHLIEGRETARSVLKMLPLDAYEQRARAARLAALMERQLDRPNEARTLLLDELRRMPDPRSPAAVPLRMRLIAERMMRIDFRAAQAVLDLMPDSSEDWEPSLELAVAAFRPMPALAAAASRTPCATWRRPTGWWTPLPTSTSPSGWTRSPGCAGPRRSWAGSAPRPAGSSGRWTSPAPPGSSTSSPR
ncbi:hypothetical protein ACFQY7_20185 [Actinomadura luteofluorescens]|uniref:hypothetical protein n=1 Tax=Actinomadura luteofluorescens TaxID=46163 RepID=UPI0036333895